MVFSIGQIVDLNATGFVDSPLLTGDRGTIIATSLPHREGVRVSWHRTGLETPMSVWRLRVYVNPMDAPGRAQGSNETMQALRVVLQEEESRAMEVVRRDLERARMTAEDLRGAAFSPYGTNYTPGLRVRDDPNWRYLTWREFGNDRHEMTQTIIGRMDHAQDLIEEARRRARRAAHSDRDREHVRDALFDIQDNLLGARYILRHEESDDSDEESDGSDEQRIIPDIAQ